MDKIVKRYAIKIAYDGTNFMGWQKQKQQRTVQLALEKALLDFSGVKTSVTGSGRTDSGVHALGQFAHFDYQGTATPAQMQRGLRRFLPDDIQIVKIYHASPDFHARYDAYERCYEYFISKKETPFNRLYMGSFSRKKLNFDAMQEAAKYFLGTHDFSSFSKDNPAVPDHVCEIKQSFFKEYDECYVYHINATRFLHNMVRRIVGSIVNISHLDLEPTIIFDWFEQKNPKQTIIYPAPPQGLYLVNVLYPESKLKVD